MSTQSTQSTHSNELSQFNEPLLNVCDQHLPDHVSINRVTHIKKYISDTICSCFQINKIILMLAQVIVILLFAPQYNGDSFLKQYILCWIGLIMLNIFVFCVCNIFNYCNIDANIDINPNTDTDSTTTDPPLIENGINVIDISN